jgi:DNA-directed RNA polymerase subunit RPC12/RpoP
MFEQLRLKQLMKELKQVFGEFPDPRRGKNSQYEMADAGLGAFSVFFIQCASFLEHQEEMKRVKGRSNAESLFEMVNIPSDNHIRTLLDPILPKRLAPMYRIIYQGIEQTGILDRFRSHANSLLIAIDGTEYFSSQKIHCPNCSHRELANGKTNYFHTVLTPVIVQAGNENVISLEPEFIRPQDGHEKQDCEIEAGKRWLGIQGEYYAKQNVTILGDDLFSRQPFCQALKDQKMHFILVCKPDSHLHLYESVGFLAAQAVLGTYRKRVWNGKHGEVYTYRYANHLPLRGDNDAMQVNWVELIITHEETGEVIYQNAFITDFEVLETTVEAIVRDGRARWKVENENNNVLKTKGYHLEHNFGHGSQYLSSLLLSLNLLAFLFHTVLGLVDEKYRLLRQALRKRQKFFQDMETLLQYLLFDSWDDLFSFMCKGLELDTS